MRPWSSSALYVGDVLGLLLFGLALLVVMTLFALFAWRARRHGRALLGVADQIWHPTAEPMHQETQEQARRRLPKPSPDDRP